MRDDCALKGAIKQKRERRKIPTASTAAEAGAATWAEVGERTTIATTAVRLRGTCTKETFRFQPCVSQSSLTIKPLTQIPACTRTGTSQLEENSAEVNLALCRLGKKKTIQHRNAVFLLMSKFEISRLPPGNSRRWYPRIPTFALWGCSWGIFLIMGHVLPLFPHDSSHYANVQPLTETKPSPYVLHGLQ